MSEGGIGWVPMLADRLDYIHDWSGHGRQPGRRPSVTPTEVLLRNFWFCSLDDPSIWPIRDRIGVDHIMVEVDYPHADSTWPDTQRFLAERLAGLPVDEQRRVTHRNAAACSAIPLPPIRLPCPNDRPGRPITGHRTVSLAITGPTERRARPRRERTGARSTARG